MDIDAKIQERLDSLVGRRVGPYNSFNPVSRVQIWQWCRAMGEQSPLYLDETYQAGTEFAGVGAVAPPAMMQMWTMRDIDDRYAPGSTREHPYQVMRELEAAGFVANVAVGYDIRFHRYLVEGDRVHHYKSVADISALKTTALGQGHFFTDHMEYLDQDGELFAEALITYFQYIPAKRPDGGGADKTAANGGDSGGTDRTAAGGGDNGGADKTAAGGGDSGGTDKAAASGGDESAVGDAGVSAGDYGGDYRDLHVADVAAGDALPALVIPITHKLIVGGAIATQDFIPVHHNLPAARAASMPDIFMNILTTCGLAGRYLGQWAGAGSRLRRLQFKLMAPNTPGDSMKFQGRVIAPGEDQAPDEVCVEFSGTNSLGPHVMGTAVLRLAS